MPTAVMMKLYNSIVMKAPTLRPSRSQSHYGNYQPEQLRKGADDDVVVNLRISEVISDHGAADTYRGMATLRIKALCQVLSNICLADWNIEANSLTYYRVPEELP